MSFLLYPGKRTRLVLKLASFHFNCNYNFNAFTNKSVDESDVQPISEKVKKRHLFHLLQG